MLTKTATRYSTLDNVDGKQARRTGTSSGLGELFEYVVARHLPIHEPDVDSGYSHGIDSLNCTLASLLETAAMGYGPTKTGAFTALIPCLPMFFSTWETYHTHTLYLGYFNGPTGESTLDSRYKFKEYLADTKQRASFLHVLS
jgi:ethanolaminephosphotransferase